MEVSPSSANENVSSHSANYHYAFLVTSANVILDIWFGRKLSFYWYWILQSLHLNLWSKQKAVLYMFYSHGISSSLWLIAFWYGCTISFNELIFYNPMDIECMHFCYEMHYIWAIRNICKLITLCNALYDWCKHNTYAWRFVVNVFIPLNTPDMRAIVVI